MDRSTNKKPWFETAFQADYLTRYAHRSEEAGAREVAFLRRVLHLPKGACILDLCCGAGRHSHALADRGFRVMGVDLSPDLLVCAGAKGRRPFFIRADARRLPLAEACFDGVVNLFTSFGYFESERQNREVLRGVTRVLKHGGVLVLDFFNLRPTLKELAPRTVRHMGAAQVVEERRYNRRRKRLEKRIRIEEPGRATRKLRESVRAYTPGELERLIQHAGLTVLQRYGNLRGAPFHAAHSPRCVLVARKDL
jgi:ubiquinone/menaquinone biosynthesis C-methylase UbiE